MTRRRRESTPPPDGATSGPPDSSATESAGTGSAGTGSAGTVVPHDATQGAVSTEDWTSYRSTPVLDSLLDKAVTIPSAQIHRHVDKLRARNPEASPAQIIQMLEREYLTLLATAGGAVGAAAAAPSVGTVAASALTTGDIATFFASSSAFALAVADVHGVAIDDVARRRTLLLATVLGDRGARDVENAIGGSTVAWGKVMLTTMPQSTLKRVNKMLSRQFLKRQVAKQGSLALGRMLPFGVGVVIGVAGGRALGHGVIAQSRKAFGPPPERFPRILDGETGAPVLEAPAQERGSSRWLPRRRSRG
ncbi:hypothetical protein LEP48_06370 [Isoptericola sp. NEAU-Y5]|uniref:EcsC family protein n=1 Tax=Isoptericola luteus TaxID=2879484 RepID=A0ABS7ZDH6_9MICO|nr:hypothetical protein [Isoptericola sp. NEAU-Y5]MCA5892978.1 hypothetical protein [Isoptericola sp. NEAU-Y5]